MSTSRVLRVALIGGPQYDKLYTRLPRFEQQSGYRVEIIAQLPHPALNAFVADAFANGKRPAIDLISTHIKYAPSQAEFLRPLDDLIAAEEVAAFLPAAVQAATVHGRLLQVPRMVDARLLFYRTDWLHEAALSVPSTWDELSELARRLARSPVRYGYVFPGRFSGLFGTFFELVNMAGGRLFDEEARPVFDAPAVEWTLNFLHNLYASRAIPPELTGWHFDEVSECFRMGRVAFAADWPAFFALYNDARIAGRFDVMRYPLGAAGKRAVYAGMHSFAIPSSAHNVSAALALLKFLLDEESQWLEAQQGAFPARLSTLRRLQAEQEPDSLAARRLALLSATIAEDMLMFPHLARYPRIEDELWPVIQQAMVGGIAIQEATARLRSMAAEILA